MTKLINVIKTRSSMLIILLLIFTVQMAYSSHFENSSSIWIIDEGNSQIVKLGIDGTEKHRIDYEPAGNYETTKIKSLTVSEYDGSVILNKYDFNSTTGASNQQLIKLDTHGNVVLNKDGLYGTVYGITTYHYNGTVYYLFNSVGARGHYELNRINPDHSFDYLIHTFYNEATNLDINQNNKSIWITSPNLIDFDFEKGNIVLTKFSNNGEKEFVISADDDHDLANYKGGNHIVVNSLDDSAVISLKDTNGNVTKLVKYDSQGNKTAVNSSFNNINDLEQYFQEGSFYILDHNEIIKLDYDLNETDRFYGFSNPTSIGVNQYDGSVVISDTDTNQVIKLDKHGNEMFRKSGFNSPSQLSVITSKYNNTYTNDTVYIEELPDSLPDSGSFTIPVYISATEDRKILVDFFGPNYNWYGKGIVNVTKGNVKLDVKIDVYHTPPKGDGYFFTAKIQTSDGASQTLYEDVSRQTKVE